MSDLIENECETFLVYLFSECYRRYDIKNTAISFFFNANVSVGYFECHGSYIEFTVVKPHRLFLFCTALLFGYKCFSSNNFRDQRQSVTNKTYDQ